MCRTERCCVFRTSHCMARSRISRHGFDDFYRQRVRQHLEIGLLKSAGKARVPRTRTATFAQAEELRRGRVPVNGPCSRPEDRCRRAARNALRARFRDRLRGCCGGRREQRWPSPQVRSVVRLGFRSSFCSSNLADELGPARLDRIAARLRQYNETKETWDWIAYQGRRTGQANEACPPRLRVHIH